MDHFFVLYWWALGVDRFTSNKETQHSRTQSQTLGVYSLHCLQFHAIKRFMDHYCKKTCLEVEGSARQEISKPKGNFLLTLRPGKIPTKRCFPFCLSIFFACGELIFKIFRLRRADISNIPPAAGWISKFFAYGGLIFKKNLPAMGWYSKISACIGLIFKIFHLRWADIPNFSPAAVWFSNFFFLWRLILFYFCLWRTDIQIFRLQRADFRILVCGGPIFNFLVFSEWKTKSKFSNSNTSPRQEENIFAPMLWT